MANIKELSTRREGLAPGHRLCGGCGAAIAVRQVLRTLALVVELLSQGSDAYRLRKQCRADGIAYLRYYYDHEGWWNTKAYVIECTRGALGA